MGFLSISFSNHFRQIRPQDPEKLSDMSEITQKVRGRVKITKHGILNMVKIK
jgi:hypothetical protein